MVTLPMLLNGLAPHLLSVRAHQNNNPGEYRGIYLLDDLTVAESNMIYIGTCDMVVRLLIRGTIAEDCVIFSAGDSEALQNAPQRDAALIVTSLPLTTLYNQLTHIILQCEDWQKLLSDGVKKGLKPLLQSATTHFGISVCLLTPNLSPVLRSIRDEEQTLMAFDSEDQALRSQIPLSQLLKESEQAGNGTVVSTPRRNGYLYALAPISRGQTVLGYLFACFNGGTSTLKNLLYVMTPIVARLILDDEWQSSGSETFQALAAQFLGEKPDDLDKLELKLRHLPNQPRRFMRGIIIRLIDEDGQASPVFPQNLRQLFHAVQNFFPQDNAAVLEDCVYVMTSDERPDSPITICDDDAFEKLLLKHGAYAMVSNPSQRLQGVRVLFFQCFQILPAAVSIRFQEESGHRCLRFDRYSPYYIIWLCERSAKQNMGSDDILYLCHPAVLTLTRYDRAFNSNLRDTLFTFLINDRSISETSRKMFMHRNTTIYKLNKIQELINDNLENPYTRHQLILSSMIVRYVEQYQHSPVVLPPLESSLLRK